MDKTVKIGAKSVTTAITTSTRVSSSLVALPEPMKRCINNLKYLQAQHAELESEFQAELLALEKKYLERYRPLYEKRAALVTGKLTPSADEVIKGQHIEPVLDNDDDHEKDDEKIITTGSSSSGMVQKGVPGFWLTVLKNHPQIGETITDKDEDALRALTDIRLAFVDNNNNKGFQLMFQFAENPYFSDPVLTKTYYYQKQQQQQSYDGLIYDHAEGSLIHWKDGKDLSVTTENKKQRQKGTNRTRLVKRIVPAETFFTFFSPPQQPGENVVLDEEEAEGLDAKLEADYELGEELKEKIIPRAIDYYTGKALDYEDFDGDDDFEDDFYDDDDDDDDEDTEEDDEEDTDGGAATPAAKGQDPLECKQS